MKRQQEEKPLWLQVQRWLIDSGFELQHNLGKNFHTFSFVKNQTVYDVWQFRDMLWEDGLELDDSKMIQVYERILYHAVQNFKQRIRNYMLNFTFDDIEIIALEHAEFSDEKLHKQISISTIANNVFLKNPTVDVDMFRTSNRATWLDHDFVLRLIVEVANELYCEIDE